MSDQPTEKIIVPVSHYEIFGYLFPGATCILSIFLFEFWSKNYLDKLGMIHTPIYTIFYNCSKIEKRSWDFSLIFLVSLFIAIYISGHIIASISSLLIDRILIKRGYGYPHSFLLNPSSNPQYDDEGKLSAEFYKGAFFWINLFVIYLYLLDFVRKEFVGMSVFIEKAFIGIAFSPILVFIMYIFIRWIWWKKKSKWAYNCLTICFSFLYEKFTKLLSEYLGTREAFTNEFILLYKKYYKATFNISAENKDTNNYWLPNFYVCLKSPEFKAKLDDWRKLYSYARNLSTAFYIAFLYCFIQIFIQSTIYMRVDKYELFVIFLIPLFFFICSFIMLYRYYYLYINYYSKSIYRMFIIIKSQNISN